MMKTSNYEIERNVFGLDKNDTKQFGDLVIKANMEQLLTMLKICSNEHIRREKRGCKY